MKPLHGEHRRSKTAHFSEKLPGTSLSVRSQYSPDLSQGRAQFYPALN
jgi:hypothetical protein